MHEGRELADRAVSLGFRSAELHVGAQATETALQAVKAPRALHIATHGFFLSEQSAWGPMQRSGLALAGAQQTLKAWAEGRVPPRDRDGVLNAEEISGLDLRGTCLVVLSACDTGLGKQGLAKACSGCGARSFRWARSIS